MSRLVFSEIVLFETFLLGRLGELLRLFGYECGGHFGLELIVVGFHQRVIAQC